MLKSFIKALVFVAGLVWAGMACAVGFGSATVGSALGQPLKVEISLTAVSDADRPSLSARLASPDAFKTAGLDYPYHLSRLKFDIVTRNGQTYIEVTSKEPVSDSFVTLLVELTWSSARSLREYTFLLDPPDYQGEKPAQEQVMPIEPVVTVAPPSEAPKVEALPAAAAASAPAAAEAAVTEAASAPAATEAPVSEAASAPAAAEVSGTSAASAPVSAPAAGAEEAPQPTAVPPVAEQAPAARETITVKSGDTLSSIAARVKGPDVTLEQMLVALYRANANKFDGKNMNRIRAGKILTVPEPEAYETLSHAAAAKEIRIQTANWNAYRLKLAAASTAVPEQASKQETAGRISTSVTDKTPAAKESAKEVLKLSAGEAPGDKTATNGKAKTPETKAQTKEEAIATEKTAKELEKRTVMLEKSVQDMKTLTELQGSAPAPASTVAPARGAHVPASGVRPATPKIAAAAPAPEPSLLDDILNNPILDDPMLKDPVYLGGGAAALLVLGGLGFYLVRRRREGGGGRSQKKKKLNSKV